MKRTALRRKSPKKVTRPRKVKYPTYEGIKGTRWTGLKGVLWTIFSQYIRARDWVNYQGRCISCGVQCDHWRYTDAGHYISVSRGNLETCFDERNVHSQCKKCNNPSWTPDASIPMAIEIDKRYGKGTANKLYKAHWKTGQSLSDLEYERLIKKYKSKYEALTNE
jgi:hypothetical protein